MKNQETEIVAVIKKANCTITVRQPKTEPTPEELEPLYLAIGKILFEDRS